MRVHMLAVGTRMPRWVEDGFATYANRLPRTFFRLTEISPVKRSGTHAIEVVKEQEGDGILSSLPKHCHPIALEQSGKAWDTARLAEEMKNWMLDGRDVALLIGGADGLSRRCLECAEEHWSLSPLTFPHALVRVIVAEQLYRAWSLLHNHPYHRA